jgi:hypothetical protein
MFDSVASESVDVVVVVDDDIPMYTHSVSLATLHFDFEFSSFPARDATGSRNNLLVSSLHLQPPPETAPISVCLAIELLPFTFE